MTSLISPSPDIPSLFQAERDIVPQPDDFRKRVVARARLAVQSGIACKPGVRRAMVGKAAAAAVVLVGLCAAAYQLGHRHGGRLSTLVVVPETAEQPQLPSVSNASSNASSNVPSDVANVPAVEPSPQGEPIRALAPQHAARPKLAAPVAKPLSDSDAYALELRILRPAQQAVGRQAFADALGFLAEHQHRFPSGQLVEEREALRVKALIGLNRLDDARRVAAAFAERFPRSALLGTIEALLGAHR